MATSPHKTYYGRDDVKEDPRIQGSIKEVLEVL
jgi:hypothetical protein